MIAHVHRGKLIYEFTRLVVNSDIENNRSE